MGHKTILLVPHPDLPGGVGNYYSVAKPYFSEGFKYIYFNSPYEKGLMKKLLNPLIIFYICLRLVFKRPHNLVVNPSLKNLALKRDGIFVLVANLLGTKTHVFWRGWNPDNEHLLKNGLNKFFFRKAFLKAHKHFVLNNHVKIRLTEAGITPGNVVNQSTLVDDSFFTTPLKNIDHEKTVILFLTRVEKYKGIFEALEMIQRLPTNNFEFHIAGNGSAIETVTEYVNKKKLSNVRFLGYLKGQEKIDAFKSSDIYLFPSYSEGMPNSVLEAMGAGLPVVCTRVGALKDFFKEKKMGFSNDLPIDISVFSDQLMTLMKDQYLRQKMGAFNIAYAEKNFKASAVIKKLEKELSS